MQILRLWLRMTTGLALVAGAANAQSAAPPPNDYSKPANWLCRPGRNDACAVDASATVVTADGKATVEPFAIDPNAPIDCFYVYPTVSAQPTLNSDMTQTLAERGVVRVQFARFASVCKPYAPMYRQSTLATLRKAASGESFDDDAVRTLAYDDVKSAWNYYLAHDNNGRGVVIIGHSQGSMILTELIRREIEGTPAHARLVSAILPGGVVAVPVDRVVGGSFKSTPLCRTASQTGCVITYESYRATIPPPPHTYFGAVAIPGMEAACTNPAALGGGEGDLHSYINTRGAALSDLANRGTVQWISSGTPITTPFVSVPGLLTAKCAHNANASGYLEITLHPTPGGGRTNDIPGDLVAGGQVQAAWGLHLVDVGLALGNLVDIVRTEGRAYISSARRAP